LAARGVGLVLRTYPNHSLLKFCQQVRPAILIGDENPMREPERWRAKVANQLRLPFWTVDADVIVPSKLLLKEQFAARTIRPRLHALLPQFLVPQTILKARVRWNSPPRLRSLSPQEDPIANWKLDTSARPVPGWKGGSKQASRVLQEFVTKRLAAYPETRNLPEERGTSELSPYLHFGHIGAHVLPFADASFDVVLSTFGVMFTPNQDKAANELARVCKPGGRIGLANWTPESFIGQLFKTIGKYVPPAPGVKSPALWGTKTRLEELFGKSAREIRTTSRDFTFRYRSPTHWLDVFRTYYGPMNKTFGALDAEKQAAFTLDLLSLMASRNRSGDRTLVLPSEYLEVVIERK
jgi:SAM-dependent methyltransferase